MDKRETEAKRKNIKRQAVFLLLTMLIYMLVYFICVGIVAIVDMVVSVNPYVKLICYIAFFFVSRFFTIRIMHLDRIKNFLASF